MNATGRRIMLNRKARDYARRSNTSRGRSRNDYYESDYGEDMENRKPYRNSRRSDMGNSKYSSRDYGYDEYEEDYMDEPDYEEYDYHNEKPMRLTKRDMYYWKNNLINADGSKGEHFKYEQIRRVANEMGIRFHDYDEKELCLTANMLYSDYCDVLRTVVSPDKELHIYVALAKAFLEDEDAPEGSEKLALYYHCIVSADE